jgi:hypothetical protein
MTEGYRMPSTKVDGLRRPTMDPIDKLEHRSHRWATYGLRVWCEDCRKPLYLGFLPPDRQPPSCPPGSHDWREAPMCGLYRRCEVCFAVEWADERMEQAS